MRYPGGKGKSFHHVINLLPPHRIYIESHVGGGAVLRHKRPAERSIAIDRDPRVIDSWHRRAPSLAEFRLGDALEELGRHDFTGEEVVYVDPPYLPATRRRRRVYRFDYSEADHEALLDLLKRLPCAIVLSGYASPFYDRELATWSRVEFDAKAHDAVRREVLWFNFAPPIALHDARFLGRDFRERERIRRRLHRLFHRLGRLSAIERAEARRFLETLGGAPADRPLG
jgi:site-specific DNA-adenine methylase